MQRVHIPSAVGRLSRYLYCDTYPISGRMAGVLYILLYTSDLRSVGCHNLYYCTSPMCGRSGFLLCILWYSSDLRSANYHGTYPVCVRSVGCRAIYFMVHIRIVVGWLSRYLFYGTHQNCGRSAVPLFILWYTSEWRSVGCRAIYIIKIV